MSKNVGKKAKHGPELVQRIRANVLKAFDIIEAHHGKALSQIIAEKLEYDPVRIMELASKFLPKELTVDGNLHQTHEHRAVSETDTRIEEMLGRGKDRGSAKTLPH